VSTGSATAAAQGMARALRQFQTWCSRSSDHSQTGMPMITVTIVPINSTLVPPRPGWCRLRFSRATTTVTEVSDVGAAASYVQNGTIGAVRAVHRHARRRWMPGMRRRDANSGDSFGYETFSSTEDEVRDHENDDDKHDDSSDNQSRPIAAFFDG